MSAQNSKDTAPGKPFEKGKSGNPGGRPKIAKEFKEKCREFMSEEGWEKLRAITDDPKNRDHFRALETVMGYAYGKPKQGVELTGEDGDAVKVVYTTKWGNSNDSTGEAD